MKSARPERRRAANASRLKEKEGVGCSGVAVVRCMYVRYIPRWL